MNTYHQKVAAKHGLHIDLVRDHWKAAKKIVKKQRITPGSPVFWHMVYTQHDARCLDHAKRLKDEANKVVEKAKETAATKTAEKPPEKKDEKKTDAA